MNAQAVMLYREYEPDEFIGALMFTAEEEERVLPIRTGIEAYVRQSIIDFIRGNRNIDSDSEWDAYIKEFEALELDVLLVYAQTAVDRMK